MIADGKFKPTYKTGHSSGDQINIMNTLKYGILNLWRSAREELSAPLSAFPRYPVRIKLVALFLLVLQGWGILSSLNTGTAVELSLAGLMVVGALGLLAIERFADSLGRNYPLAVRGLLFAQLALYVPWRFITSGTTLDGVLVVGAALLYFVLASDPRVALTDAIASTVLVALLGYGPMPTAVVPVREAGSVLAMALGVGLLYAVNDIYIRRSRLAAATALMGVLAHELRTPLATITLETGYLFARAKKADDQDLLAAIAKIQRTARYLNNVIDTQIANARASALPLTHQNVDVGALVRGLVADFPFGADEAASTVEVEVQDAVFAQASETVLRQIVTNLLRNALTAVQRTNRRLAPGDVRIVCKNRKGHTVIEVADKGVGIPKQDLQRIFDPFFSTSPSANHGLGLAFVRQAVRTLGGRIDVDSTVGEGSTFTVDLPAPVQQDRRLG